MKWIFKIRLFCLDIGRYRFSPGLIMTILTIALAYVMFSLGQWQLSRAQYKDNLQQKIAERKKMPAIGYSQLPHETDDRIFLPVKLKGSFDAKHSILLDNKVVHGIVGYEIFTPFMMANGVNILVNRGFVPLGKSRQVLPDFDTPEEILTIQGLMEKAPSKAVFLAEGLHEGDGWPMVFQYIDITELETKLDYRLMNMIVRLAENEAGGFKYHQPVLSLNSAKNNGYAFQWFAMMTALLIIYIVVNTKKRAQ